MHSLTGNYYKQVKYMYVLTKRNFLALLDSYDSYDYKVNNLHLGIQCACILPGLLAHFFRGVGGVHAQV